MRKHELLAAMLVAVVIAGFVGCSSDDGPTTPPSANLSQQEADDVALQTLVTVGIFGDDLSGAIGSTPLGPRRFGAHRTPTLSVRPVTTLWDTAFAAGGLNYSASRTFYDAADVALADYGPTAVRVHWESQASGLITGPRDSATVGHSLVLDVRGIEAAAETLLVGAVSRDTLLNKFQSLDGTRTRIYQWKSLLIISGAKFAKADLQFGPRPVGSLTLEIQVDRLRTYNRGDIESHFDCFIRATFNGTNMATLVVDNRYTYSWNIDTGEVTRL